MREVAVHDGADAAASALADRLVAAAEKGGRIALTGGSSPRIAYRLAAESGGDFSRAALWFGDDRCVPPDHEHSNYGMAKAALLDALAGEPPAVHRIKGELGPHEGAADYEHELGVAFGDEPPAFDLVLLGLGPDMHCASLFPNDAALGEEERPAVGVEVPGMAPLVPRVTLTLPVLNAAREVVFLVTGADKADAVAGAFEGPPGPHAPASLVQPDDGTLTLLLDREAAAGLEHSP